jgi:hypothetical protein
MTDKIEVVGVRVIQPNGCHLGIGQRAPVPTQPGDRALPENNPSDQVLAMRADPPVPDQDRNEDHRGDRGGDSVARRSGANPPDSQSGANGRDEEAKVGYLVPASGGRVPRGFGTLKALRKRFAYGIRGSTQASVSTSWQGSSAHSA